MPDAPLTRETLARLVELRDEEEQALDDFMCSDIRDTAARERWETARDDFLHMLENYVDALLAAAERGLGAGDGR